MTSDLNNAGALLVGMSFIELLLSPFGCHFSTRISGQRAVVFAQNEVRKNRTAEQAFILAHGGAKSSIRGTRDGKPSAQFSGETAQPALVCFKGGKGV